MRLLIIGILLLVSTDSYSQAVPSYVPSNGLMGWWPFNGNCIDESGNGYNGINTNALLTPDRFGIPDAAYKFNGTNSFIRIPNLNFQSGWSVGFWMKADSLRNNLQFVIGLDCFSNFPTIGVSSTSGLCGAPINNLFLFDGVGTCNNLYYGGSYTTEQYHHIVYTKNLSIYRCYINGQLSATHTALGPLVYITDLYFGTRCGFLSDPFGGELDDIGVWNRALDSVEVRTLFESCSKSISQDVTDQTAFPGGVARFVVASSIPAAGFQWQADTGSGFQNISNNIQYSGVNNDTLIVSNITNNNNQQAYRCLVSWGSCTDTSSIGLLTVTNNTGILQTGETVPPLLFPTPAVNEVFLRIDPKTTGIRYQVLSSAGNPIKEGTVSDKLNRIDLSTVPTGIYVVVLGNGTRLPLGIIK